MIPTVAMIFDLEKRSIVSSTFHTLCRILLRRTGPFADERAGLVPIRP
jgi:hypothetical protein